MELDDQIDKVLKLAEEKIQKKKEETEKIEKVKASLLEPEKEVFLNVYFVLLKYWILGKNYVLQFQISVMHLKL